MQDYPRTNPGRRRFATQARSGGPCGDRDTRLGRGRALSRVASGGIIEDRRRRPIDRNCDPRLMTRRKEPMKRKEYEKELRKLQVELCALQDWVRHEGLRVVVIFEGRDAAGKGGTIKAITERVSPRVFRVVALPAPSDREKSQMYIQRYITHFPAAGEIVIFDRSWYNRAGVEYVMGFIDEHQHKHFLEVCPTAERYMVDSGITLIKIWLEVGQEEQERRFDARINDPLRQWKLSPMD